MRLHSDWKRILKRAASVRLALLAGLLSGLEAVLPLFTDAMPRGVFAGLSVALSMAVLPARIIAQRNLTNGDDT